MDKVQRLIFLHFEKMLIGLFGLGLLYSLVWHGPWTVRTNFSQELGEVARKLASVPPINPPPPVPSIAEDFAKAGIVAAQQRFEQPWVWPVITTPEGTSAILPPADVAARANRGYNSVKWELNPNQAETKGDLEFVGVEVDRSVITPEGEGPFEIATKVGDRPYMSAAELRGLSQKVAAITLKQTVRTQKKATTGGTEAAASEALYSVGDLFNALHDGLINDSTLRRLVRINVNNRAFDSEAITEMNDTYIAIRMTERGLSGMGRGREAREARARRAATPDLRKAALEEMGFTGGGKYVELYGSQNTAEAEAEAETTGKAATGAAPAAQAAATAEKPAEVVVPLKFPDVTMFVDTKVSSDLEYRYRVRFWAVERGGSSAGSMRQSDYAPPTTAVSPKPDTEFYLASVLGDGGKASVVVRKWMPASNKWSLQSCVVSPGEQIGRAEYRAKTDTAGMPVLDAAGTPQMEAVDFSTSCVLLDARYRPRAFEQRGTPSGIDPLTGARLSVDNVQYVLYDTPQIVYSDRKGTLRVKWQSSAELS